MKKKSFISVLSLLFFIQCTPFCKEKLNIVIVGLSKGDRIEVNVDDGTKNYKTISEKDDNRDFEKTDPIISGYCNGKDSIKLAVKINNLDTLFYVNPKHVRNIYIGKDIQNNLFIRHTFTNGTSDFTID